MSRISEAVRLLRGDELIAFLRSFPYVRPSTPPSRPPAYGTPEYGAYYNAVADAGVGSYQEDAWSEIEHLRATGELDRQVYYAVLEHRQRKPDRLEQPREQHRGDEQRSDGE